jgi:hypothetical protein
MGDIHIPHLSLRELMFPAHYRFTFGPILVDPEDLASGGEAGVGGLPAEGCSVHCGEKPIWRQGHDLALGLIEILGFSQISLTLRGATEDVQLTSMSIVHASEVDTTIRLPVCDPYAIRKKLFFSVVAACRIIVLAY